MELQSQILDKVKKAQESKIMHSHIYEGEPALECKNEFLFFIKPEVTLANDKIKIQDILDLVFKQIDKFNLKIQSVRALSAEYLKEYDIIANHYGVINKIASNAIENISDSAQNEFEAQFGVKFSESEILGGFEFLNTYKDFNAESLDFLWQNSKNIKLAGGTYCEKIKLDDKMVYLVNGFHPRQLVHFTNIGRSIIVFNLIGDLNWSKARNDFIGSTNPLDAKENSLRKLFLDNMINLGLAEVSQGMNGAHLSAGPVEGLVELIRYNSDFSQPSKIKAPLDFSFGKQLSEHFSKSQIDLILSNPDVFIDGKKISIFDLTEEKDSNEAMELLKRSIALK
ncbi:MAG: hypothetical protein GY699_23410 [Desulfobacteraceae bacterium]|nr:hypothetical protein [Desulfobacteraceae bacterium]